MCHQPTRHRLASILRFIVTLAVLTAGGTSYAQSTEDLRVRGRRQPPRGPARQADRPVRHVPPSSSFTATARPTWSSGTPSPACGGCSPSSALMWSYGISRVAGPAKASSTSISPWRAAPTRSSPLSTRCALRGSRAASVWGSGGAAARAGSPPLAIQAEPSPPLLDLHQRRRRQGERPLPALAEPADRGPLRRGDGTLGERMAAEHRHRSARRQLRGVRRKRLP